MTIPVKIYYDDQTIEISADTETLLAIDIDGRPFLGVDFGYIDGGDHNDEHTPKVVAGMWPNGWEWERIREVALDQPSGARTTPPLNETQTAAALGLTQAVAALALADLDSYVWLDQATSFTCGEANAIAAFLDAFHGDGASESFLIEHATGDDEGDEHWGLTNS